ASYSSNSGHSAESYFKDVDSEPPRDSTVHRVDSGSDAVQRPYEPPAGSYSQTGVDAAFTYKTMDREQPYDVPGDGHSDEKLRYGGKEKYAKEKGPETSAPSEGPAGKSAGGRKPEGR
ncbi:hypothetical protein K488DRAFT_35081, partial [Vararia minispora EC-137]